MPTCAGTGKDSCFEELLVRIFLTGADGFTGIHFARRAEAAGHNVVALRAQLHERQTVQDEVLAAAPDVVVHLAAISFVGHSDEQAFYSVNVMGTLSLLAAVARLPRLPRSVLLASSANIYGNCERSPIMEDQAPAPVNHYAMSKLAMEHMSRTYLDRLPIIFVRPFNYTGRGQASSFIIPKLVDHFLRRAPSIELGNVHVEREFNDVRMVCDAYMGLMGYGERGGVYNVCSGRMYALQHVIDALKRLTGHCPVIEVNPRLVRANEVNRLCGDPARLQGTLAKHGITLDDPQLEDTLLWMLE
jgi:GDP-6-deoxy-D-talose 4-dehydrogenase